MHALSGELLRGVIQLSTFHRQDSNANCSQDKSAVTLPVDLNNPIH